MVEICSVLFFLSIWTSDMASFMLECFSLSVTVLWDCLFLWGIAIFGAELTLSWFPSANPFLFERRTEFFTLLYCY